MRSTLLTLAGGDPMPAAAISKLLSMRTGQGYAEFAVSSFGTDGAIGDPDQLPGQVGGVSAGQPGHNDLRWHIGGAAQHHRRTAAWTAPRPVREGRPTTANDHGVTLRQLRYFAVLGEELNYRRAAERLFITQPALSTAIKQLEHQLGVMLFTRTTREVALTELGLAWLPKVKDALRGLDSAVDELIALSAHYRRIRLGYLIGTGADLLFRLVRHFEAAYPEITVGAKGVRLLRPDGRSRRRQHGSGHHSATGRSARAPDVHPRRRGLGGLPTAGSPAGGAIRTEDRRAA